MLEPLAINSSPEISTEAEMLFISAAGRRVAINLRETSS